MSRGQLPYPIRGIPLLWFEDHVEGIRSWPADDHMKNIPPGNTDITSCCRLSIQESLSFIRVNMSLLTLSGRVQLKCDGTR
jgi:hypothetical protein